MDNSALSNIQNALLVLSRESWFQGVLIVTITIICGYIIYKKIGGWIKKIIQFLNACDHHKKSVLNQQNKCDEAIKAHSKAITITSRHYKAWGNNGLDFDKLTLENKGRHDEAIKAHDKAPKFTPQLALAEAWNNKGNDLLQQGKYDEAILAYDEAVKFNPQLAAAWSNKGLALDNQGKYDEAIKAHDMAIKIDPQFVKCLVQQRPHFI